MSALAASALGLLVIAIVLANAPFFSEKYFFVKTPAEGKTKGLAARFLELLVMYLVTLGLSLLIESRLGDIHKQGWQFYAITVCLFLVFAYPGFVVRYLKK
jgi:hypothetical protein